MHQREIARKAGLNERYVSRIISLAFLAAIAWKYKSSKEEVLMVQRFGDLYTRYRTEVKGLVPYIW